MQNGFICGGAGFIGSHLAQRLLEQGRQVVIYDNFSSGQRWHLQEIVSHPRLRIEEANLRDPRRLVEAMAGVDTVFHFASNPDIAKAATQPDIDFWEGTYLTQNVLEAMRLNGVRRLLYASGSGVYGDTGSLPVVEDYGPMRPISTYGASKLACEALICSYCHLFDTVGRAFRFANVVGPRQTHGVAYDFIRRLMVEPGRLDILGDGQQSKSYIHVDDVLDAMLLIGERADGGFDCFNVATEDYVTVRQIADVVVDRLGLRDVEYHFAGGARGWKGDVPVVRFNTDRLRAHGWSNRRTSLEALRHSIDSMIADARKGLIRER